MSPRDINGDLLCKVVANRALEQPSCCMRETLGWRISVIAFSSLLLGFFAFRDMRVRTMPRVFNRTLLSLVIILNWSNLSGANIDIDTISDKFVRLILRTLLSRSVHAYLVTFASRMFFYHLINTR